MMKKIILFGGTGFIGKHLMKELGSEYEFILFSRDPSKYSSSLPPNASIHKIHHSKYTYLFPYFEQAHGIINLAGESVSGKWSHDKKKEIASSRLKVNRLIRNAFENCENNIQFVLQGSGIAVYGKSRNETEMNESSRLGQRGFLRQIGSDNEKAFYPLRDKTRVIFARTGIVLDKDEGALPELAKPFMMNMGGKLGGGKQWVSWIHIQDEVSALKFLIEHKDAEGAYNLTAPNAVRQKQFSRTLGKVLGKSSYFTKPGWLLRLMVGDMANELLLTGLSVKPKRLEEAGFKFKYTELEDALNNIYKSV